MATVKKLFSFDDVEDKDILNFLDSIKPRRRSSMIRDAIRLYMGVDVVHAAPTSTVVEEQQEEEYEDAFDILKLGQTKI